MSDQQEQRVFGKKAEKHILILASGDRVRHMTVRPWMAGVAFSFIAMFGIGYLVATTYLVLRDDLIGATMARQARMQHDYEDRIASLRAQVDRITSRQLLDQQVVEDKVEKLLEQQTALSTRHGKMGDVLERAENFGLENQPEPTDPAATVPEKHADAGEAFDTLLSSPDKDKTRAFETAALTPELVPALAYAAPDSDMAGSMADRADQLFSKVTLSLKTIEHDQIAHIQTLTETATDRTTKIHKILKNTGVVVPENTAAIDISADDDSAMGGPYAEPILGDRFESSLAELDTALDRLERVRKFALRLPFSNPAPGKSITSVFGNRVDPFFGKLAMHAGIDFRQPVGTKIVATGAGTVIHAGPAGGYGIMVEIDHGNGITTRYGHLSRVLVSVGDTVQTDSVIALSGSTGRSTGPHLHYEVRRNGTAVDPMRFLNAGMKLTKFLD